MATTSRTKTSPKTKTSWKDAARASYGWYVELYDAIPELKKIIDTAVKEKYSAERFVSSVKSTKWWKTQDAAQRQYTERQVSDPATLKSDIEKQTLAITQLVGTRGYQLSADSISALATNSIKYGWDSTQLERYVGAEIYKKGTTASGGVVSEGTDATTVDQYASAYGLRLTDAIKSKYVQGLVEKTMTTEQLQDMMKSDAMNLYPSLRSELEKGRTVDQATSVYRQMAATTLGVDPDSLDFTDPNKWGKLLSYKDPTTNENRLMNATEWGQFLRSTNEWQNTDAAKQTYRDLASTIVRAFGKVQ
jgi:hypothetical protein